MKTSFYKISNMSCASCSRAVEKTAQKQAGVQEASVNLATEKMSLTFDPQVFSEEDMVLAIEKAGFGVAPVQSIKTVVLPVGGMT